MTRSNEERSNGRQEESVPAIQHAINEAQKAILTQRTPPQIIKQRPGKGGRTFNYVEHAWVTEQLNLAFGWNWSWDVVEWRLFPNEEEPRECTVLGRLTVMAPHGPIVKMQFGSAEIKRDRQGTVLSIGDDLKAASSDALKKAASLLGLALDLYSEDISRYEEPARCATCRVEVPEKAARLVSRATDGTIYCKAHYTEWREKQQVRPT